jgi:hypothetical protein
VKDPAELKKHYVISDARDWILVGTRFVSPISADAVHAMHFVDFLIADSFAEHIRLTSCAEGVKPKKAKYFPKLTFDHPEIGLRPVARKNSRGKELGADKRRTYRKVQKPDLDAFGPVDSTFPD